MYIYHRHHHIKIVHAEKRMSIGIDEESPTISVIEPPTTTAAAAVTTLQIYNKRQIAQSKACVLDSLIRINSMSACKFAKIENGNKNAAHINIMMADLKLSLTFPHTHIPLINSHPRFLHFQPQNKIVLQSVCALGDSNIELDIWKCVQ